MGFSFWRSDGCRVSDQWTYLGLRVLILENDLLRVVVLLDKGSDIVEFRYKPRDLDFLLHTPQDVRNPHQNLVSAFTDSPFLDYFSGGWNEVLPNGGGSVVYKGATLGQHGEISLLPWECTIIIDTPDRVAARVSVKGLRTPFRIEKTLSLERGRAVLTIGETLTNEAGEVMECMWGQHIAFGRPFLDEGARIDVPARRFIVHEPMPGYEPRRFQPNADVAWSQVPAPDGVLVDASLVPAYGAMQAQEMAYLTELDDGWYAVTNAQRRIGFGVRFDHTLYRYLWYWQQLGDVATGYPWWGRLHTAALEPWTSYPTSGLNEAIRNGTALVLQPGQQIQTTLRAVAYEGCERVISITPEGDVVG
jgi:hypothetical protein